MKHTKLKTFSLLIFVLCVFLCSFSANAQKRKTKISNNQITKAQIKNRKISKIVSLGVINGHTVQPEDLIKPNFPPAARAIGAAGAVHVQVLIDENGYVVKAEAVSGHPLLRPASISAARRSKFIAKTLGGVPIQVRGVIVYNFVPQSFNWLEIGFVLRSKGTNDTYNLRNLIELLPAEFELEGQMLQTAIDQRENNNAVLPLVSAMIESKLSVRPKDFWLFSLGSLLSELEVTYDSDEETRQNFVQRLNSLVLSEPENVKHTLTNKLRKLNDSLENFVPEDSEKAVRQVLKGIQENMSFLGR